MCASHQHTWNTSHLLSKCDLTQGSGVPLCSRMCSPVSIFKAPPTITSTIAPTTTTITITIMTTTITTDSHDHCWHHHHIITTITAATTMTITIITVSSSLPSRASWMACSVMYLVQQLWVVWVLCWGWGHTPAALCAKYKINVKGYKRHQCKILFLLTDPVPVSYRRWQSQK